MEHSSGAGMREEWNTVLGLKWERNGTQLRAGMNGSKATNNHVLLV